MDETLRETPTADDWRQALAHTIDQQRQKVGQRIAGQRERLRELESQIATQLEQVAKELAARQDQATQAATKAEAREGDVSRRAQELDQQRNELAQESRRLTTRQQELSRREAEVEQLLTGLAGQTASYEQRADALTRDQAELKSSRAAHDAALSKVQTDQAEIHRREAELTRREHVVAEREKQTTRQRRHVAQQLRNRQKELAAEAALNLSQTTASGSEQVVQLQMRLAELQGKYDRLHEDAERHQQQHDQSVQRLADFKSQLDVKQQEVQQQQAALDQAHKKQAELESEHQRLRGAQEQLGTVQQQLDDARRQAQAAQAAQAELDKVRRESQEQLDRVRADQGKSQSAQVQSLQTQVEELKKKLAADQAAWETQRKQLEAAAASRGSDASPAELKKLREANRDLESKLAAAEARAQSSGGSNNQEVEDLRRRFEMAVQDVRELKTKNSELTDQLSKARQSGGSAPAEGAGQGWESLKKKMLAQLESDFDENVGEQKADKLTVQGAIKITDQVVAEKEHELQELRRLLDSQAQQVGEVAVGAQAVAQLLDTDELVRQERESLKTMQESLREQLRKAEVDISLERAKVARERAELDEKIRGFESERANAPSAADGAGDKGKKPAGRKWLQRLGLGDNKEE